jgi:hypothetical protein
VWFWLLVVFGVGFAGCSTIASIGSIPVNSAQTPVHTVVYSVTGDGTADVTFDTFVNGTSGTSRIRGTALPWKKTEDDSNLYLYSLGAKLTTGSTITCTITVDGTVVSTRTSSGPSASAECTGWAPGTSPSP